MRRTTAWNLIVASALAGGAIAQDAATDEPPEPRGVPSLQELLGLEGDPSGTDTGEAAPGAPTAAEAELDQALSPGASGDRFEQAVALMDLAAARLGDARDAGRQTQRVQADILAKLDQVIASAREGQGGSSSSSSGSSGSSGSQQGSQQSSAQSDAAGDGNSAGTPSDDTNAAPRGLAAPAASSWGALPDRVRDALTQGLAERYSTLYERMTREYYLRLAEEGSR